MQSFATNRSGIGGRERDKNVSRAVARVTAVASETERDLSSNSLELRRNEGSVGGENHDDGSDIGLPDRVLGNLTAHVNASDPKLVARSVVALHENADRVAPILGIEHSRAGADATLKVVTDHAGPASDVAFFDRP